tara:strand:+ start:4721 stop:5206 length:486 start_codon:yes stop_codon:yes gene_type:complete
MANTTAALNNLQTAGSSAPLISEILTKVNNAKDKPKKVAVLRENDSQPLRQILKGAFDPKIKWDLPEGTPPYSENDAPAGTEHTTLYTEARRLYYFVDGAATLSKTKKETMFIQMLESLHADDAKVLIAVKEKNLNKVYKGLTAECVKEAFDWNDSYTRNK